MTKHPKHGGIIIIRNCSGEKGAVKTNSVIRK